jgi:hypothetical protein
MDIITRFWERQAIWMAKVEGYATFAAIILIGVAVLTVESGKPFGFVAGVLGIWCFGIRMVYELWHVDEHGDSKIRNSSPLAQFIFSSFYAFWFIGLAFVSMVLYAKINS